MSVISVDALVEIGAELQATDPAWRASKARGASKARHADAGEVDARAVALAERLPPSVEGHGGDAALFHAAREIGSVLGNDAAAIERVLVEAYNPRCAPPWDGAKLRREAERAAEAHAGAAHAWARRRARAEGHDTPRGDGVGEGWPAPVDWSAPEAPIEWYCKGLGIAPSDAKITLIGGLAGAGKGPLANYLAVCFATGRDVFGRFPCRKSRVLLLDFEGARLTARRIRSHCRGLGIDAAEALGGGRLTLQPSHPEMMHDLEWLRERVEAEGIEVLIIDSYMSAMADVGVDPNSPEFAHLARELGRLGIVTIVIAHARKPTSGSRGERPSLGDIAGSFALGGYAQTGIAVYHPDDEDRLWSRVACMRAPEEPFPALDLRWAKSGPDDAPAWSVSAEVTAEGRAEGEAQAGREARRRIARAVVSFMAQNEAYPYGLPVIATSVGQAQNVLGPILGGLCAAGILAYAPHPAGRGGTYMLEPGGVAEVLAEGWPGI